MAFRPASSSYGAVPVANRRPERVHRRRPGLVRAPGLEHLGPPVGDPQVRAAELVRRADQHVGVDRAYVDRFVRGVVDRVNPRQRTGIVRELADSRGVDDRPDRVRRPGERDDPRPLGELGLQVIEVERRVGIELDVLDDQVAIVRELQPGGDAAVVVCRRDQDLVTGVQGAAGGAREREVERCHVGPERDLVRFAAEETGRARLGLLEDLLYAEAGRVAGAEVRARLTKRARDRVTDLVGDLRTPRSVEKREPILQRGEPGPHVPEVGGLVQHVSHRQLLV